MLTRRRTLRTWIVFGWVAYMALSPRAAAAAGADPATATRGHKNEAQKKFDKGRELSAAKRYPEALAEFRASYEIVASPNTHFSIGRALAAMGQLAEAYVEFGKTMTEAQTAAQKDRRYQQTADAAEIEQRDLRPKLAFLVLSVEHADGATVKVGDREIDAAALGDAIPVAPGTVIVLVSSGGAEVARQSVTLATADRKSLVIDARPRAPEPPAPVETREPPVVVVDT
jgi:tetratricopeptide (TPR) repeat protein